MNRKLLAALALFLAGCAVRQPLPATWRFTQRTLAPPGVATLDQSQSSFPLDLPGRGPCPTSDAVAVQRRGRRLTVTVLRDSLLKQPPGWLAAWAAAAEAQGCIPPASAALLTARILESLPLPPNAPLRLLRADHSPDSVELTPGLRLQVISPILREGALTDGLATAPSAQGNAIVVEMKSSPDLIGFETAWYEVRSKPSGAGATIVPLSAETSIAGKLESRPAPRTNYFQFPPAMGFYRLFYKADQSEVIAMAPTRAALPASADSCPACFAIPRGVGVNPYLTVTANGTSMTMPIGATLAAFLRNAHLAPEVVLPTLTISKPWHGKLTPVQFDPKSPDILQFVLTGDEQLRW